MSDEASGTMRAVALGLVIGLLPVVVVLAATSGLAPNVASPDGEPSVAGDLPARFDPAYVDEQLARYAATPAAPKASSLAWTSGVLPGMRPAAPPRPAPAGDRPSAVAPAIAPPPPAGTTAIQPSRAPAPRPASALGAAVPPAVRRWESLIVPAAARAELDPNLLAALMMTESGGNPDALSAKGAVGLMQIVGGPRDPAENVERGAAILAGHLARYGRADLALAAYNAGTGAVDQHGGVPPYRETRDLVFRVLLRYDLYSR